MGDEIDAVRTPASPAEQASALVAVLREKLGKDPPLAWAEIMLAQLCLENANGKGLWNDNPGNLTSNGSGTYYILKNLHTDPLGKAVPADDPSAVVLKFQAFQTLKDGVATYASWVLKRKAFIAALDAGDCAAYAKAIETTGYCPGINVPAVAKSLAAEITGFRKAGIFNQFGLYGIGAVPGAPAAASGRSIVGGLLAGLVAGGAYWLLTQKGIFRA
jgi:hypothetical protein